MSGEREQQKPLKQNNRTKVLQQKEVFEKENIINMIIYD